MSMLLTKAIRVDRLVLTASAAVGSALILVGGYNSTRCEKMSDHRIRKRSTVIKANTGVVAIHPKRANTREELSKIRGGQDEIFRRWELDEDGWRELPARAWPKYQPNPEQLAGIQVEVERHGCKASSPSSTDICQSLLFNVATALVFYSVDPVAGFQQYEQLAWRHGNVDAMVACGIILVEGLGGFRHREAEGVDWLQKAVTLESTQGMYELGTVYYTGIDDVVDEDPEVAFSLFQKAADKGHVGAMYMMADCLIEGEGTKMDVARAIPLLYQAADQGHRYARQRVRELLNMKAYK
ncbi:Sel1 domain protein repeat-containing protein [Seminavis robusta]|uniref:Sel1 domain protein repeat-containing protein n=1 Tax=Seminavis robusta TaxID=568900 RepID=A0A9N8DQP5_9STRA|nr:Sel1 domain protein repeat-containing protein [Seminavis robusta]|eukprot:Sro189_g081460.1 Sel1 domain protein repeat-containing protein (297) ;mRNA; f:35029-35919